jgi:hypothetical protein
LKAIKAIYEKGKVKLFEKPVEQSLSEDVDDPWQAVLNEKRPRPAFQKFVDQCQMEIKRGNSRPLNVDSMK